MDIIIEGERITTIDDFHLEIKKKLGFPEYYGENLNALWDCLTSSIDLPVTLIWRNFDISKANLENEFNSIIDLFSSAEKEINGFSIRYENTPPI
ncbi:barstar family protein [Mucilaginibacter lappiensis]|jgi:ribonuclease inhibitor|uniref:barstar family protein n=1 Tax=Mucilaginibacter lappiensis TaxID=354630 RepID=UPI003D2045C1